MNLIILIIIEKICKIINSAVLNENKVGTCQKKQIMSIVLEICFYDLHKHFPITQNMNILKWLSLEVKFEDLNDTEIRLMTQILNTLDKLLELLISWQGEHQYI